MRQNCARSPRLLNCIKLINTNRINLALIASITLNYTFGFNKIKSNQINHLYRLAAFALSGIHRVYTKLSDSSSLEPKQVAQIKWKEVVMFTTYTEIYTILSAQYTALMWPFIIMTRNEGSINKIDNSQEKKNEYNESTNHSKAKLSVHGFILFVH